MSRPAQLTDWQAQLTSRFPELPSPVVAVLALYSFGVLCAHVCGLSTVVLFLAPLLGCPKRPLRKRLTEFYKEAQAKSGVPQGIKRRDFDVSTCFAPLLGWILSLWSGQHLPLAIDVTNLGARFHVLCVSVVVRGVGIPVAWKVLRAGVKDPWNPHWERLLQRLKPAVPAGWTVLVLSDRGLESPALFRLIAALDWHPLMRVKKGGKFRPKGWSDFHFLHQLVDQVGVSLSVPGHAYASTRLRCTLLACWDAGHAEPWLLLTDLPPEAGNAVWYGLRCWIEQGFKLIKGGGWDWQKTRMTDPGRVERLWLVLAVATLWVVALGAAAEVKEQQQREQQELDERLNESKEQAWRRRQEERQRQAQQQQAAQQRQAEGQQRREQARAERQGHKQAGQAQKEQGMPAAQPARESRVDRTGLAELHAQWQQGKSLLPEQLHPEPWLPPAHCAWTLTEQDFLLRQKQT
jgi:hypothetical protein